MQEIRLKALAKINLGLDVVRKREDGYHDLRMIMQTVGLYDRIYVKRTQAEGIRVKTNLGFLPTDRGNLVTQAAALLMEEFHLPGGVFIDLDKHIPVAAGLAGGSSDAAAVLTGMNTLFHLELSEKDLMDRGVKIGADVPYCIMRGTALAEGIGDILTPLPAPPACSVILAKPAVHVSTRFVYGNLKADEITQHPDIDGQIEALKRQDLQGVADRMGNVLEQVTVPAYPVIRQIREELLSLGAAGAMMSGSGPTVFGLFKDPDQAQTAFRKMKADSGARQVFLTEMVNPKKRRTIHDRENQTAGE